MCFDFHLHTTASDGTFTPSAVVQEAAKKGLQAIAITDHDTISGLEEAEAAAQKIGIELIKGIEFSTDYFGKEVHIIGLFIDTKSGPFLEKLEQLRNDRITRAEETIAKLKKYKIDITMNDIISEAKGDVIGRMHIANVLYKKGFVPDRKSAFLQYLGDNGAAYVPKRNFFPEEAVKTIKENGGLAVIAHPKLITLGQEKCVALIDKLTIAGLDGIEAFYPGFTLIDNGYYKRLASERGLIISGGSDFHGSNREEVSIGSISLPADTYEKMKERLKKQ